MRYALGHRSSPFHRFGAICGLPSAPNTIYFDICHQTFHRMTLRRFSVSSRDWLSWRGPCGKGRAPGHRAGHFIASERTTAFQTRFVSDILISAISRFIR